MRNLRLIWFGLAISFVCSIFSVLTVEVVASRGVKMDLGVPKLKDNYTEPEYQAWLIESQKSIDSYLAKHFENASSLDRHKLFKPSAWAFTWWPWLLSGLLLRNRALWVFIGLLSLPLLLTWLEVFYVKELLLFSVAALLPALVAKFVRRDTLEQT